MALPCGGISHLFLLVIGVQQAMDAAGVEFHLRLE